MRGSRLFPFLLSLALTLSVAALVLSLAGCGPESGDTPRPAHGPVCDRCGPRPTLSPIEERKE